MNRALVPQFLDDQCAFGAGRVARGQVRLQCYPKLTIGRSRVGWVHGVEAELRLYLVKLYLRGSKRVSCEGRVSYWDALRILHFEN